MEEEETARSTTVCVFLSLIQVKCAEDSSKNKETMTKDEEGEEEKISFVSGGELLFSLLSPLNISSILLLIKYDTKAMNVLSKINTTREGEGEGEREMEIFFSPFKSKKNGERENHW